MERIIRSLVFPKLLQPSIRVFNRQKDLPLSKSSVVHLTKAVLLYKKALFQEVNLYFVTEKRISQLHKDFFQDPTSTDCITFPIDSETGEIFVCPKTALIYAETHSLDPYEEVALYVIHGILHLLGYDDLDPARRRVMRKNEKQCMAYAKATMISLRP